MHLFMHGGHGDRGEDRGSYRDEPRDPPTSSHQD
jgi:hypothetical protein